MENNRGKELKYKESGSHELHENVSNGKEKYNCVRNKS